MMFISICFSVVTFDSNSVSASNLPKFFVNNDYDSSTPGWQSTHFNKIQDAIDEANKSQDKDRIIVYEGIYYENIVINNKISLFGEDSERVIIDGGRDESVIIINAENVDISTFTIRNSGSNEIDSGIKINNDNARVIDNIISNSINGVYVKNAKNVVIAYNDVYNNDQGIYFSDSNNSEIHDNDIYNNLNGIYLNNSCYDNEILNNNIYSNSQNGLLLQNHSYNNTISENSIYSNQIGIRVENCSSNIIHANIQIDSNTYYGIMIAGSDNIVTENSISENNMHGIFLISDNKTIIEDNIIKNNVLDGIRLQNSTSDTIKNNIIIYNKRYGIFLNYFAVGNKIVTNYFQENTDDIRDISREYNDVSTNYFYRLLVADIQGRTSASVGEKIFFDASESKSYDGEITLYSWDFGDGNTKTGENVSQVYSISGTFTVKLTIENSIGVTDVDTKTVIITEDTTPPVIRVIDHGLLNPYSNIYFFKINVTDNVAVKNVVIEYWYEESDKRIADMETTSEPGIYEKKITTDQSYDRIYCVIYAYDTSENIADTKTPFADPGGPYENYTVLQNIKFNASESFDLDGNITEYNWEFGDGVTKEGEIVYHKFNTNGIYNVKLTVIDDDQKSNSKTVSVSILPQFNKPVSLETKNNLEIEYNITLDEKFVGYDTNSNGKIDTFIDPNKILIPLHEGFLEIDEDECFLLSIDNDYSKIFIWNARNDTLINVSYQRGTIKDKEGIIDKESGKRTIYVNVEKIAWTYFEIEDLYKDKELLNIKRSDNNIISSDFYWRSNNKIFVLDNPDKVYEIIYKEKVKKDDPSDLILEDPVFYPSDRVIDVNNNSITITYNMVVDIEVVFLRHLESSWVENITLDLVTTDYKTYTYTPPNNLADGMYQINIEARNNDQYVENSYVFEFFSYSILEEEKSELSFQMIIFICGIVLGLSAIFLILIKKKKINFESFIYFKNKKIFPFIKPVVFGPLQIDVDDDKISKAEFYVNGTLKETLTKKPFKWVWDETTFMKHNIETKIYSEDGNSQSTGDMTFFIFNPPKIFK